LFFAVNVNQLCGILREVLPALHEEGVFWIAYPKITSKIATDLSRACSWDCIHNEGFESLHEVALDHVWTAGRFTKKVEVLKPARKSAKRSLSEAAI